MKYNSTLSSIDIEFEESREDFFKRYPDFEKMLKEIFNNKLTTDKVIKNLVAESMLLGTDEPDSTDKNDPYCYANGCLKNKFNIRDAKILSDVERKVTYIRSLQLDGL